MNKCPKCGTEFEGNFCPECGTKWQEDKICPLCGASSKSFVKFCSQCGSRFPDVPVPAQTAKPIPAPAPARSVAKGGGWRKFLQYFPAGLLLLFSLLLWAFYAAPVFKVDILFGSIEGNLYQIYSEELLSDLRGPILALYIFTALCIVGGIAALYFSHRGNRIVPAVISGIFYLVYLILGVVLVVFISKYEMSAGACPILILVFASVFALLAGVGLFLGQRFYPSLTPEEKAARAEEKQRRIAEAQAQMKKPVAPEPEVKKPKKPSLIRKDILNDEERAGLAKQVERHVQNKRIAVCFSAFMIIVFVFLLFLSDWEIIEKMHSFSTGREAILIACGGVFLLILLVALPIMFRKISVKQWHPEKVYWRGGSIALLTVVSVFLALFFIAFFCCFLEAIVYETSHKHLFYIMNAQVVYKFPFYECIIFHNIRHLLDDFIGYSLEMTVIIAVFALSITSIVLESKAIKSGRALSKKLCGYVHLRQNKDLVGQYNNELVLYKTEQAMYNKYRHERTVYRYSIAKYNAGKPYEGRSYPKMWIGTHKLVLSGVAVGLAAVIAITSGCFFGTYDFRFSLGKIKSIELGTDRARVEAVFGEPDMTDNAGYYYYGKKVSKRLDEIEELTEKMLNSSSMSEAAKYEEKIAELQQELSEMENYKIIQISFASDGVVAVRYNSKQMKSDSKKAVKSVTLSPSRISISDINVKVVCQIEYKDGSYCINYLSASVLSQATSIGANTLVWGDTWGEYSATLWVE